MESVSELCTGGMVPVTAICFCPKKRRHCLCCNCIGPFGAMVWSQIQQRAQRRGLGSTDFIISRHICVLFDPEHPAARAQSTLARGHRTPCRADTERKFSKCILHSVPEPVLPAAGIPLLSTAQWRTAQRPDQGGPRSGRTKEDRAAAGPRRTAQRPNQGGPRSGRTKEGRAAAGTWGRRVVRRRSAPVQLPYALILDPKVVLLGHRGFCDLGLM
eukprot:gene20801-biopygen2608